MGVSPSDLKKIDYRPASLVRAGNRQVHLSYARCVKFVNDLRVVYEIQSRFQPENAGEPSKTPDKKNTDQLERLFYDRLESRLRPAVTHTQGDQHEMRNPS